MKTVIRLNFSNHLFFKKAVPSKASSDALSNAQEPEEETDPSQNNPGGSKTPPSDQ